MFHIALANRDVPAIHATGCADIARDERKHGTDYWAADTVDEFKRLGLTDLADLVGLEWVIACDYGDGEIDRDDDDQVRQAAAEWGMGAKVFNCAKQVKF